MCLLSVKTCENPSKHTEIIIIRALVEVDIWHQSTAEELRDKKRHAQFDSITHQKGNRVSNLSWT